MQKLKQAIAKMLNAKHYNQKTIDRLNQMTEQSYKMTNKPLLLYNVVVPKGTLCDDEHSPVKVPKNMGYGKGGEKVYI